MGKLFRPIFIGRVGESFLPKLLTLMIFSGLGKNLRVSLGRLDFLLGFAGGALSLRIVHS